jgi:SAM-dependent methyltransferase
VGGGQVVSAPPPGGGPTPGERHWFEDVADHLGPAYLRYSFTRGTAQEVAFLRDVLALEPGMTVLDVGCGPGRHAVALAKAGVRVVAVDVAERFLEVGEDVAVREGVADLIEWHRLDARRMDDDPRVAGRNLDAAISLCQGAFGLGGPPSAEDPYNLAPDAAVLAGMLGALRPGGRLAVSAFSSYFQVRWLESTDAFDAATAVNHEHTELLDEDRNAAPAQLWTTCYTPRELVLLAERVGLEVDHVHSVSPGGYQRRSPDLEGHEFLLVAHRPVAPLSGGPERALA